MSKIALYPGSFKPPHVGHFENIRKIYEDVDEINIIISSKDRDGTSAEISYNIWNLYKSKLGDKIKINISKNNSPVLDVYNAIKDNSNEYFLIFGKDENSRFKLANKDNVRVLDMGNYNNLSATNLRQLIKDNKNIEEYIPKGIDPYLYKNMVTNERQLSIS